jgi:uncharacterized HAD superfamily protein
MSAYQVPNTSDERKADLNKYLEIYTQEYKEFKEKGKKVCGSRAKKSLTVVKKLITGVRRDIQEEIDTLKKSEKQDSSKNEVPKEETPKESA